MTRASRATPSSSATGLRAEQLFDLLVGGHESLLFVHLRQGLGIEHLSPRVTDGDGTTPAAAGSVTGFDPTVQRLLASVRTDLDSFTDVEACSLGLLGCCMTNARLNSSDAVVEGSDWWIWRAQSLAANPSAGQLRQLAAARSRWTRPLHMVSVPARAALVLVPALAVAAYWKVDDVRQALDDASEWLADAWNWQVTLAPARVAVITAIVVAILLAGRAAERSSVFKPLWWLTTIAVNAIRMVPLLLVCVVANLYLGTVDRWVLKRGELS
jgi:hypothetical protein